MSLVSEGDSWKWKIIYPGSKDYIMAAKKKKKNEEEIENMKLLVVVECMVIY